MKSYTDLEQGKKLVEILSLGSADMYYTRDEATYAKILTEYDIKPANILYGADGIQYFFNIYEIIPCWSLAALLNILPKIQGGKPIIALDDNYITYPLPHRSDLHTKADNLVDACVEMILKLNELNLL